MIHEDKIKDYFQEEINRITPPPFPGEKGPSKSTWKDMLATAACVALVVAVLINPASQHSRVRSINLSAQRFEEITSRISQVFQDAAPYLY